MIKKKINIAVLIQREEKLGFKDIDHILPFLYFLNKSNKIEIKVKCFIFNNKINYNKIKDPRISYLSSLKNVELIFLDEKNDLLNKIKLLLPKKNLRIFKILNNLLSNIITKSLSKNIYNIDWKKKLGNHFLNSNYFFIFSLVENIQVLDIVKKIKKLNKKAKWILLPHGTTLCENKMVLTSDLDKNQKIKKNNIHEVDFSLKTSKYDTKDISQKCFRKRNYIIGSPRYNKEWLKLKSNLKLDGDKIIIKNKKKIRVLFLLPKMHINIFTEELIRTLDFLSSYKQFEVKTINYYNYPRLPIEVSSRKNLTSYIISKEFSTSQLIDWAQIVFHAGTGIIFESFLKNKITVFPKYLTCNRLFSEKYNAGYNLRTRDDLRIFCNKALMSIKNLKKNYIKDCFNHNKKFIYDFVSANSKPISYNIEKKILSIAKIIDKN